MESLYPPSRYLGASSTLQPRRGIDVGSTLGSMRPRRLDARALVWLCAGRTSTPFMRSERPCAFRDRLRGQGKESGQGVASSAMHQSLGNASDPKTPPSGASAKFPPLTFHHAKIALVHVTESRVPMNQVLYMTGVAGGPSHAQGRPPTSFSKTSTRVITTGGATAKSEVGPRCAFLAAGGR